MIYVFGREQSPRKTLVIRSFAVLVVFKGTVLPAALVWNIADLTMG